MKIEMKSNNLYTLFQGRPIDLYLYNILSYQSTTFLLLAFLTLTPLYIQQAIKALLEIGTLSEVSAN